MNADANHDLDLTEHARTTSAIESSAPVSAQRYADLIEQGVRRIVTLCTQTIIVIDPARDARTEKAVRGVIAAAVRTARIDELERAYLAADLSANPRIKPYLLERIEALKADPPEAAK